MIPNNTMLVVNQPILSLPVIFIPASGSFDCVAPMDTNTSPINVATVRIKFTKLKRLISVVLDANSIANAVYALVRTAYNHTNGNSVMTRWPVFIIILPEASTVGVSVVFAISARLVANT